MNPRSKLQSWLASAPMAGFSLYTATVAFLLYTCVYGFRKTFSIATFDGLVYAGISFKVWLVTAQVAGYAVSKFIGIKVVSEMKAGSRVQRILQLVLIAWLSWLLFAVVPRPYNIVFLFLNGLPLGMIWGLIFSYLEGRRTTDLLGAGLSVSFIFSAGFTKTVGASVMSLLGTTETWMPFVSSCLFFVPLLGLLWLLDAVPPPDQLDRENRTERHPMNSSDRKQFIITFAPGLALLIIAYLFLTSFRDFRDNFTGEIWAGLGYRGSPQIFTTTEVPITVFVLVVMGSLIWVRNNRRALFINHLIILSGFLIIGGSTLLFQQQWISPTAWMICTGLGLYLAYVPFNSIFFDRLLAAFKYAGTVGFVMYLADSIGYLGSVGVLFYKEFGQKTASWLNFYQDVALAVSVVGFILMLGSLLYFERKLHAHQLDQRPATDAAL
ncbi:MAG: DUF5690 family protein [Bacteroidota bacterium]